MNQAICNAIQGRKVIRFFYDGGFRMAEPHCHGESKEGNELLRAYQTDGYSESGNPQGWKLFRLDEMTSLTITDATFSGARPYYNPADKDMVSIYCCL
jgi:hypothetical protein